MKNYDDIINLPHPTSRTHARMSQYDRAAQFSPFAALTGYDEAISETARLTDRKIELSEYEAEQLSEKINTLLNSLGEEPEASVTYFVADKSKPGGCYVTINGNVKKIDLYERVLITTNGDKIPLDDILTIEF